MKVVIRITVEHYSNFIAACDTASPAYPILTDDRLCDFKRIDRNRHVVKIVCTENDALTLLSASVRHCHYVTGTIGAAIDRERKNSQFDDWDANCDAQNLAHERKFTRPVRSRPS
jgi:hypothetical protein